MAPAPNDAFDDLLETLSEESLQDETARTGDSFLVASDAANLVRREKEYSDPEKQFVRGKWLRFGEELQAKLGRRLKYLTLPAYYRFDVTMMLQRELLDEETIGGRRMLAVAAFESDPAKFARMAGSSPGFQLLGDCALEDAITDPQNRYHGSLQSMFPFDIINFDLTTSLTPKHEGPYSRIMMALDEVMKRQALRHQEWVLFLTFRNTEADWEPTALRTFITNLQTNLDQWPAVRDKFVEKMHVPNADELHRTKPTLAIIQSVGKWLVDRAHVSGQSCERIESYHYKRYSDGLEPYTISKLLMRFKRGVTTPAVIPTKTPVRESWMQEDLVRCIDQNKHKDVEMLLLDRDGRVETIQTEISGLVEAFNQMFTHASDEQQA